MRDILGCQGCFSLLGLTILLLWGLIRSIESNKLRTFCFLSGLFINIGVLLYVFNLASFYNNWTECEGIYLYNTPIQMNSFMTGHRGNSGGDAVFSVAIGDTTQEWNSYTRMKPKETVKLYYNTLYPEVFAWGWFVDKVIPGLLLFCIFNCIFLSLVFVKYTIKYNHLNKRQKFSTD